MSRLLTLKSAALLAVAGTSAGIFLGNRAIDSVDPFFYSPLPSQSFAALSSYRSPTVGAQATLVSAEETRDVLGGCVGCRTYPEEYDPRAAVDVGPPPEDYSTKAEVHYAVAEEPVPVAEQPDPARVAVQRYASYAVTEPKAGTTMSIADDPAADGENAEMLRAAEDKAVPRGPDQLIY